MNAFIWEGQRRRLEIAELILFNDAQANSPEILLLLLTVIRRKLTILIVKSK